MPPRLRRQAPAFEQRMGWSPTPRSQVSGSQSPSRKKYVRNCGLETTAIIPLGARTIPSSRSVPTCSPAFPAGRGPVLPPPPTSRPTRDSKGSRFATLVSLSAAGAELVADAAGFLVLGAAFLAAFFGAGLDVFVACVEVFALVFGAAGLAPEAAGLLAAGPAGLFCPEEADAAAGFAGACATGFAAGLSAGFVVCDAVLAAGVAGLVPAPLTGLACACRPEAAAASVIPSTRVFTKRIFRSFPFRVFPPASPQLRRRHSAW